PHPGEILLEEFLKPMGLSQNGLARAVHVAPRRINEIVLGKRDITADTDLRLARYFGMSEGFFLGLQADYELMQRRHQIGDKLKAIRLTVADARAIVASGKVAVFLGCESGIDHEGDLAVLGAMHRLGLRALQFATQSGYNAFADSALSLLQ